MSSTPPNWCPRARFLVFDDRLFVHFNNDWNTTPNQIFLAELAPDTLQARSAARPLALVGLRQPCEKNWLLFEHDGELFAIYQVSPHVVLRLEVAGSGPVPCWPVYRSAPRRPLRDALSFTFGAARQGAAGRRTFAPTFIRPTPLLWPEREGRRQRPTASHMTPCRVVYLCGLVRLEDGRWLVSYGVHDEQAVSALPDISP